MIESNDLDIICAPDSPLQEIIQQLPDMARNHSPVYIQGESGTGKELFGQALHHLNPQSQHCEAVNCATLPENLVASELFGYEPGAFSGALKKYKGAFLRAHQGTLFLDEIGDLPLHIQVQLLRVIQEKELRPLGSEEVHHSNFRLICATHRDLWTECEQGNFREDLFFRLAVLVLRIPPLRERPQDIPLLVHHFCDRKQVKIPNKKQIQTLQDLEWRGNVRELMNVVERWCFLHQCQNRSADIEECLFQYRTQPKNTREGRALSTKQQFRQEERQELLISLRKHRYNKAALAREMQLSRTALVHRLKRVGIE